MLVKIVCYDAYLRLNHLYFKNFHQSIVFLVEVELTIPFFSYKQYLKSRPGASVESVRRIKSLKLESMAGLFCNLLTQGSVRPGVGRSKARKLCFYT